MAPHRQAMLRGSGQPLTMVSGPKEASRPDCSVVATPYSSPPTTQGNSYHFRSSGLFLLSAYVTGAWGQEKNLSPEEPPVSQTPSHLLSGKFSRFSFHNERNQAPQLQHCSNCVQLESGLMAVAERWLWKADKALTAMLTATGWWWGGGGEASCLLSCLLQGRRQEWPQRPADPHWLLLAWRWEGLC